MSHTKYPIFATAQVRKNVGTHALTRFERMDRCIYMNGGQIRIIPERFLAGNHALWSPEPRASIRNSSDVNKVVTSFSK